MAICAVNNERILFYSAYLSSDLIGIFIHLGLYNHQFNGNQFFIVQYYTVK